ncbi:MAG: TetR/AcrR family transcriptional regulator [Deltaproteobacteria bacterium]|nr:TetR/AcrR family transcriptional regulator [Deltaproteobacteria bacterium]
MPAKTQPSASTDHLGLLLEGVQRGGASAEEHPTRKKMIAAAIAVFAEQGFRGATTRLIASRAGVAEKTIFAHYRTKAMLFAAAVGPGLEAMMGARVFADLAPELMRQGSAEERLVAVALNRLRFASENVELVKAIVQETLLDDAFRQRLATYWAKTILPVASAGMTRGMTQGRLREMPPERILRMFISLILGYVITRYVLMPEHAWDDEAEARAMVDVLLRGLGTTETES